MSENQQRDIEGNKFIEGAYYYIVDSESKTPVQYLGLGKEAEQSKFFVGTRLNSAIYKDMFVFCFANNPRAIKIPVETNVNIGLSFERYTINVVSEIKNLVNDWEWWKM
jgi:hypothetical protein